MFGAHLGNWELVPYIFKKTEKKISIVYREANNKYVDKIINKYRNINNFTFIPKGKKGAKLIIQELKAKNIIIMLVDQRMRDGMEVPFFNIPAMTAPAIASLALQYKLPIVPIHTIRVENNRNYKFEIFIDKPLQLELTGNKLVDIKYILIKINKVLEKWISKNPSQWFWIHNRWAKNKTH
jgi:KDO2-lipid IV(A) lauroyltransferase